MGDLEKYVLDRVKVEVEHTRSWPAKIMAFYVSINVALMTMLFAFQAHGFILAWPSKAVIIAMAGGMLFFVLPRLLENHRNYLTYRNIQVRFQQDNRVEIEKQFDLPPEWYMSVNVCYSTRWRGYGFYLYLTLLFFAAITVHVFIW